MEGIMDLPVARQGKTIGDWSKYFFDWEGPSHLVVIFLLYMVLRFRFLSQTFSPWVKGWKSDLMQWGILCQAILCAARASLWILLRS